MTPTVPGDLSKWERHGWTYKHCDVQIVVPPGHMVAVLYVYEPSGRLASRVEVEIRTPMEMIERAVVVLRAAIAIGLVTASDEGKVGG